MFLLLSFPNPTLVLLRLLPSCTFLGQTVDGACRHSGHRRQVIFEIFGLEGRGTELLAGWTGSRMPISVAAFPLFLIPGDRRQQSASRLTRPRPLHCWAGRTLLGTQESATQPSPSTKISLHLQPLRANGCISFMSSLFSYICYRSSQLH